MKRARVILVGLVVFVTATMLGLTLFTAAGTIGIGGNYDMPPAQTQTFVQAAARKLNWLPDSDPVRFLAPVLPWVQAQIEVRVEARGKGSHVEITGHATKVKELDNLLKRQLPALQSEPGL